MDRVVQGGTGRMAFQTPLHEVGHVDRVVQAKSQLYKGQTTMKIFIHPFEQVTGFVGWDGLGVGYVWGSAAVALGKHHDNYNDSAEWAETLDTLEAELIEVASASMGHDVRLAPEYI